MCVVEIEKQRALQPSCTFPRCRGAGRPHQLAARCRVPEVRAGDALLRASALLHVLPREWRGAHQRLRASAAGVYARHELLGVRAQLLREMAARRDAPALRSGSQPLHPLPAVRARVRRTGRQSHTGTSAAAGRRRSSAPMMACPSANRRASRAEHAFKSVRPVRSWTGGARSSDTSATRSGLARRASHAQSGAASKP